MVALFRSSSLVVLGLLLSIMACEVSSRAEENTSGQTALLEAVTAELSTLDARKAAAIEGYNLTGARIADYSSWCSTYGLSALRNLLMFKGIYGAFRQVGFPVYFVYSQDPYFKSSKLALDEKIDANRLSSVDLGKCLLADQLNREMSRDPKHFEKGMDEFSNTSFPFLLLAGNLRLIDEEKEILLELKGILRGSEGKNPKLVGKFVEDNYSKLAESIKSLRARTLLGYEFSFRVPLGEFETYGDKQFGMKVDDKEPASFISIFERRTFYVNQARLHAGLFFESSARNFSAAEAMESRFLKIIQELYPR